MYMNYKCMCAYMGFVGHKYMSPYMGITCNVLWFTELNIHDNILLVALLFNDGD